MTPFYISHDGEWHILKVVDNGAWHTYCDKPITAKAAVKQKLDQEMRVCRNCKKEWDAAQPPEDRPRT